MTNINGPINILFLTGKVEGINKQIHLFCDAHIHRKDQTKCPDNGINIDKYFDKKFREVSISPSSPVYDFFMEIKPSSVKITHDKENKNYINTVLDLFIQHFKTDNFKVKIPNKYPKIRLHYVDVRDYLFRNIYNNMENMKNNIQSEKDLDKLEKLLVINNNMIQRTYNIFYKTKKKTIKKDSPIISNYYDYKNDHDRKVEYLILKIKNKYHHTNNKNIINKIINIELKNYFTLYSKNFNSLINDVKNNFKNNLSHKIKHFNKYYYSIMHLFSFITDLYFLRRFVDKDYITHGIAYTGLSHSVNYLYLLVKYFNFDLKYFHYFNKKNEGKYSPEIIKNIKYPHLLREYFMEIPIFQCSSIAHLHT